MSAPDRLKRIIGVSAAALGLTLGAAGVATAVSGPNETPGQTSPTGPGTGTSEPTSEANETNETPEQETAERAAEDKLLNAFPVKPDQASKAALAAVPGTVEEVEVSEDTASPVFEVEIIDANGKEITVTVDPNSGAVTGQMTEANEGPETNETNEAPATPQPSTTQQAPATP